MIHSPRNSDRQPTELLLTLVKEAASHVGTSGSTFDAIGEIGDRLNAFDVELLLALQRDRDAAMASIRGLVQMGQKASLFALLANLGFSRDDELLEFVINFGLKGDVTGAHKWLVNYDIVGQRLAMLQTIVLPYLTENYREKTLFYALKSYEAEALAFNRPLVDPQSIHNVIGAVKANRDASFSVSQSVFSLDRHGEIRLVLPNETFNTILRLAWTSQDYLFELHERYNPSELLLLLKTLSNVVPVYLIPTHLGYPMGGGESFMHQTCRILSEFAVKCIWISFQDPLTGWYKKNSLTHTPYYVDIRHAGGQCRKAMQRAIKTYCPDLVHAQGNTNDTAMELAERLRCTTMIGYHFWSGLIDLGHSGNQHIIENLKEHRLCNPPVQESAMIWKYVASEFMQDIYARLGGGENLNVIHPVADSAHFQTLREEPGLYVLQINVTVRKGGRIFLDCVRELGSEIPFLGIQGEPEQSDFFTQLNAEIAQHSLCALKSYGNVRDYYRNARLVIVPTLVDETFCRVAYEAAMNGIPVITTANGFLPLMFGDTGVYLSENSDDWVATIRALYHDLDRLKTLGERQRARLQTIFGADLRSFIEPAMRLIDNSATRNLGIFAMWGDKGQGNHAHTYSKLLRRAGYKVHIFSFQPYSAIDKSLVTQNNPADWSAPSHADNIHYSFNHRELVTTHELRQFVLANRIRTLLVMEICWKQNWNRLFDLKCNNLSICGVPLIEIVVRGEVPYHNRLTTTLYCTHQTEQALTSAGVRNGVFIGHGFAASINQEKLMEKRHRLLQRSKIRFLHVAGHNPKTRKNTPQVIEAFARALTLRNDIELTVTSMAPIATYYPGELPEGINVLDRCFSRDEILSFYEEHDVSIQVSSHEGLGLGFYESISRGTPVLSLDAPPHNEIVIDGETGWLIPAQSMPVPDNRSSIVLAWRFDTNDLTNRIVLLDREAIGQVMMRTERIYKNCFDEVALLTRFLRALPKGRNLTSQIGRNGGRLIRLITSTRLANFALRAVRWILTPLPTRLKSLIKRVYFRFS